MALEQLFHELVERMLTVPRRMTLQMEEDMGFAVPSAESKARIIAIERALAALTTSSDIIELRVCRSALASAYSMVT